VASGKSRFWRLERIAARPEEMIRPRSVFSNVIASLTIPGVIRLEEAQQQILAALPAPALERVALANGDGRILGETIVAAVDLPPFDNSAMDGYAVRAADVTDASTASPVRLRVVGRIPAGGSFSDEIHTGECVRLFTGSEVPRGGDRRRRSPTPQSLRIFRARIFNRGPAAPRTHCDRRIQPGRSRAASGDSRRDSERWIRRGYQ
jgi:hypothetical protein